MRAHQYNKIINIDTTTIDNQLINQKNYDNFIKTSPKKPTPSAPRVHSLPPHPRSQHTPRNNSSIHSKNG